MSDVTEEPPVGSVVQGRDGRVAQRVREERWYRAGASSWMVWERLNDMYGPLTLLQPVPEPPAPPVDPDTDPLAQRIDVLRQQLTSDVAVLQRHIDSLRDRVNLGELREVRLAERVQALEQAWLTDAPTEDTEPSTEGPWRVVELHGMWAVTDHRQPGLRTVDRDLADRVVALLNAGADHG